MASDWEVEDELVVEQRSAPEAGDEGRRTEYVLQRLRIAETGSVEYRFGYRYRHPDGRSQWVPNSPRIPVEELQELVRLAAERGWIRAEILRQLSAPSLLSLKARVEELFQGLLARLQGRRAGA